MNGRLIGRQAQATIRQTGSTCIIPSRYRAKRTGSLEERASNISRRCSRAGSIKKKGK